MTIRLSVTLIAAVCLVGCDNSIPTNGDKNTTVNPASSTTSKPTEMKTTASGLKYLVMKQGTGTASPKATDTVKVHYHGTLLNGTVFDSSVQRNEPISFPLNGVIPGWKRDQTN